MGGAIAPVYVQGRFTIKESELTVKEGKLSSSISSKVAVGVDVECDVVDNIYCARNLIGYLAFAAYLKQ